MSNKSATLSIIMAVICFAVALVPLLGFVMADDMVGRVIFSGAWALLGVVWISNFLRMRKK